MPKAVNDAMDAPLDERAILGSPDEVRDRLIEVQRRLGLDLLIARPQLAKIERSEAERSLRLLAEEIWPAVIAA